MASIRQLAEISGFHRDSIKARIVRFGLKAPYSGRDIFTLRPLDDTNRDNVSLEQARTRESTARAEKCEIEVETLQKERIPLDTLNQAMGQAFAAIRATIDASDLSEKAKSDICDSLVAIPTRLRW